ncbi:hypothetical protein CPB86DRAFT_850239 [Serendipita vermifera]|nr:hypothetical protein CPB86DRAFT_850239 [Serendipita vermifera]
MDRSFINANIAQIAAQLSTEEKIALLGAPSWWDTNKIERLNIPSIRMSDGPNGVRGSSHFKSSPAQQCIPCATALASSFDPEQVAKVGEFLAEEAKIKNATLLLAPTCNIQRSPLGGRSFESFSEDPYLSGTLAAAYVSGLQQNGVGATIKHFVANEQEKDRTSQDSVVSERALREVYLYPFMIAQRDAKPFAFMTSYNRLNGIHCSENPRLLQDILRREWGFDGLIMSDWYGTYGVDQPINAGLDLEMPGPPKWRTPTLINQLLSCKKLTTEVLTDRATQILSTVQKLARLSPEQVYSNGEEHTRELPEHRKAFCRQIAADGIVLLRNEKNILPLLPPGNSGSKLKVAVIGQHAKTTAISGGGSAALKPTYVASPWKGLNDTLPQGVELSYTVGGYAHKYLPTLEDMMKTEAGEPGWLIEFLAHDSKGEPTISVANTVLHDTRVKLNDFLPKGLTPEWSLKCCGIFTPDTTGPFEFGLTVAGRAKLFLNGKLLIDNWTTQRPGEWFYGQGSAEETATADLVAGKTVEVMVLYTNTRPPSQEEVNRSQPALMRGVRLGGCPLVEKNQGLSQAADLASKSDVAVVFVGLNSDWESEGFDRSSLSLPRDQDELISTVAKANPATVVVIQAGSAISMPWVNQVQAVLQTWYLGNEVGNAIADILYGTRNPSGKLPISFPVREQDIAAHLNFGGEYGVVHYREEVFVGYKHFDAKGIQPLFPFGWGLSYTTFELSDLKLQYSQPEGDNFSATVTLTVKNCGSRPGSEVVQIYVGLPKNPIVQHPEKQLRAFKKVKDLKSGSSVSIVMQLDKYALAYWHEPSSSWRADAGDYTVKVGTSSTELNQESTLRLEKAFIWTGI